MGRLQSLRGLRTIAGLFFAGYGLLVVLRVVAHEAFWAGALSLALGVALLLPGLPALRAPRAAWVAGLGGATVAGVLLYNLAVRSGLGAPEWGLLAYGAALLVAAPHLGTRRLGVEVSTLVGWSFPLVLAPLFLFALHGVLSGPASPGADADGFTAAFLSYTLVWPTAFGLELLGTPTRVSDNNIFLATPRGTLSLGIGLVCAGIYPMVLFLGVLGLHAWREGLGRRRLLAYVAVGLAGLWLTNLLRLLILAKVGQRWGAAALQQAHAHLGWLFFAGFMVLFWAVVLRRWERPQPAPAA